MASVPLSRIRSLNTDEPRPGGQFVLYWMIASRRPGWNFSLQRAVEIAQKFDKPLLILEALRCDYQWASERFHQFVIEGMRDNEHAFKDKPVTYYPYIEHSQGGGTGLLRTLCEHAVSVVTDDFPCFFLPRMIKAVALRAGVAMESVDSNGIYPMRATDRVFTRAYSFRRHLQKEIEPYLQEFPQPDPLKGVNLKKVRLPVEVRKRWPAITLSQWTRDKQKLAALPIDHAVGSVDLIGGHQAAKGRLKAFLKRKLHDYGERNQPELDVASGLSPYLHFGHISAHEIFSRLIKHEKWSADRIAAKATGSSSGWWGMSEAAEGFVDELITWRELGYNMCALREDFDEYETLPDWAQTTLAEHQHDRRDYVYSLDEFEESKTHDPLWNAAQRQLVREGKMHNYLRMLWGKKILEWTLHPREALEVMIELNNKYALDGRNPNSYSGIFWVLGRYDRAWGPERPVFGKIRFMSSDNTARKVKVKNYIQQYGPANY